MSSTAAINARFGTLRKNITKHIIIDKFDGIVCQECQHLYEMACEKGHVAIYEEKKNWDILSCYWIDKMYFGG